MLFELVHYLHIVTGVTWAGAAILSTLVWGPALVVLEPDALLKYWSAVGKRAGRIMSWVAPLVILTGLFRAYMSGRFRALDDIVGTYGLAIVLSVAIFVGIRIYGKASGKETMAAITAGEDPRPAMRKAMPRDMAVYSGSVLVLLGLMTAMGTGRI